MLLELKDSSDRYRDASSSTGGDQPGDGGVPCETQTNLDRQGVDKASGGEGPSDSSAALTQTDTDQFVDDGFGEEELKEKHNRVCTLPEIHHLLSNGERHRSGV